DMQRGYDFASSVAMDPDEVWRETMFEPDANNRVYEVGGFLASTLRFSAYVHIGLPSPQPPVLLLPV
ncbi:hypothetical protein PIB30_099073, partial [Stylosanthes scabra]|nr:hypothetical protein [Stylosanthes scabra]